MASQQQTRFVLIIITTVSLCQLYDCASYKQLLQNDRQRTENKVETAKLVRVRLTKSQKMDSFESLSRSHNIFQEKDTDGRKPFSLNSQLVGSVGIGSPKQEFRFIFDTTYANMWIPSLNCTNCGDKKRYNSSASTTYIEDGTYIQTGWDAGFRSIDQVSIGDIIIKNQTFAEMVEIEDKYVSAPYDGLFCLAYDAEAQEEVITPLQQMLNQGLIDHEVFSFYQNSTGGEIVFGGVDQNHFKGLINWVPSYDLADWAFRMDSLTLKQKEGSNLKEVTVCANGCKVHIYTYMPYIIGPPEEVMMINEAMGAELDEDDDTMFVLPDCDLSKLSNLVFKINFDKFEFRPDQYIQKVRKGDKVICVSSLHAVNIFNHWFIGSSIVGHIYTVFDYKNRALGFAHTK